MRQGRKRPHHLRAVGFDFPGATQGYHYPSKTRLDIWHQSAKQFEADINGRGVYLQNSTVQRRKRWITLEAAKAGVEKRFRDDLRAPF